MSSLKRIDLFLPLSSQYRVLHHFTSKLYEALIRAGFICRLLTTQELELCKNDPPDLTIGFNGVPRNESRQLFCDLYRIPHLACLVDPPYHFLYLFNSPFVIAACDDQMGCRYLQSVGFLRNFFLPHAVEPEILQEKPELPQFDLVMLGTFIDFEKRQKQWREKYPAIIYTSMDRLVEEVFSDSTISYVEALDRTIETIQRQSHKKIFQANILHEILMDLEYYIKGRDRVELVKSVQEETVHIFGASIDEKGWKEFFGKKKTIKVHSPINYSQALQVLKKTKILLNPSLKNREGAHERVFTGLASGALVITAASEYLLNRFQENKELIYYRYPSLNSVSEAVSKYLADEPKRLKIVEEACQKIAQGETWDHRVLTLRQELPKFVEKIKRSNRPLA